MIRSIILSVIVCLSLGFAGAFTWQTATLESQDMDPVRLDAMWNGMQARSKTLLVRGADGISEHMS
ncbi:hypothetical protein LCGC14_1675700 [marine sediment metagenome]|uniref:Uncharacterized protein n=1 Tax=marine sediment metagenome TaxID=412755 RepID=A0A0F9HQS0_9ZZZZ